MTAPTVPLAILRAARLCVSEEDTAYTLLMRHVLVRPVDDQLHVVATDGRLLLVVRVPVEDGWKIEETMIPYEAIDVALRVAGEPEPEPVYDDASGVVQVATPDWSVTITRGKMTMKRDRSWTATVPFESPDLKFPPYLEAIPAPKKRGSTVPDGCAWNPYYLQAIGRVAEALGVPPWEARVRLEFTTAQRPMVASAGGGLGFSWELVLMPVSL